MPRPRDSFISRVFNAEGTFNATTPVLTKPEQQKLLVRIGKSAWWRKRRPDITGISLFPSRGYVCVDTYSGDRADVRLPIDQDVHMGDVLHAVAHHLQPRDSAWHGPEFAKAMLDVVGKYAGMDERRRLAQLYKDNRVKTVVWSQEAKERAKTRYQQNDLKALLDELRTEADEVVTPPS